MRAYCFPILFFSLLMLVLVAPYTGVLLWAWVTMMNPHQIAGGWIATFPLNSAAVVMLALGLLLHRESVLPPLSAQILISIVFLIWCLITTQLALSPYLSAARADLSFKNMIFGLVIAALTTSRIRCQALVWIFVLSYGYFGIKGGIFTILTRGAGNVIGPAGTGLEDRNALALVMLMTIPLANFLRITSSNRQVQLCLVGLMILHAVAVLGTYSRGGLIGLLFLGAYFWWTSPRKLTVAACAMMTGLIGWSVLPDRWFERMSSVQAADSDASFEGRVDAWHFAFNAASSRLTGVGFSGTEDPIVFHAYMPITSATENRGRAAHSIYFQVLGDHGFIGLGLFLAMLAAAWRSAGRLLRIGREHDPWFRELGTSFRLMLTAYCITGAALSMAYDSSIFCLLGLIAAAARLRSQEHGRNEAGARRPRRGMGMGQQH